MTTDPDLLKLLNEARAKKELPLFHLDDKLGQVANLHAAYMLQTGILSHFGRKNSSFDKRIKEEDYMAKSAAENIAFGAETASEVIELWMSSPDHKRNILNPDYTEIGIGVAPSFNQPVTDKNRYWSVSFAAPSLSENDADEILTAEPFALNNDRE